jgi:hypothetical protein
MTPVVEAKCQLTGSIVILAPLRPAAATCNPRRLAQQGSLPHAGATRS